MAGSAPNKRKNSVALAMTLNVTQAGKDVISLKFMTKGDFLHGVSGIPVTSMLQKIGGEGVKYFRLSHVAERCGKEREKEGHTFDIFQRSGETGRSSSALSYEQFQSCADVIGRTWNSLARKTGICTNTNYKVKGTSIQACDNFFRQPNRATREKVVASRSDCKHEDREFIVDCGASLHMMSKNELASGEKDTIIKSTEPTVIMTVNGKAESTEEAVVHVHDMDVFVTMMLLEDSPAVISLGVECEEMGFSYEWKKSETPSLMKMEQ